MSLKCFTNLIFFTTIRGHHVYKRTLNPFIGDKLTCRKDNREEAQEIDIHAVGIYKKDVSSEQVTLVFQSSSIDRCQVFSVRRNRTVLSLQLMEKEKDSLYQDLKS